MEWTEVFIVFLVSHLAGDFLLQTEFQATQKPGGLGRDRASRRALLCHIGTYALAFVPAMAWLSGELDVATAAVVYALVLVTHLVQDDARLLQHYVRTVKHTDAAPGTLLWIAIDQSAHVLVLFGAALLTTAL